MAAPARRVRAPAGQTDPLRSMLPRLPLLFLVVWLAGTVIVGARVLAGFMRLRAVTRTARPLQDLSLRVRAHGIATDIGVRRQLRLLEGDAGAMPITFGAFFIGALSIIGLPPAAERYTEARLTRIAEQLMHREHGIFINLIVGLIGGLIVGVINLNKPQRRSQAITLIVVGAISLVLGLMITLDNASSSQF